VNAGERQLRGSSDPDRSRGGRRLYGSGEQKESERREHDPMLPFSGLNTGPSESGLLVRTRSAFSLD
jgi:hypothetical protein